MSDTSHKSQGIKIGDTVAYRLRTGEPVHEARGRVLALFNERCGRTLADVAWDKIGPPARVEVTNLTKV